MNFTKPAHFKQGDLIRIYSNKNNEEMFFIYDDIFCDELIPVTSSFNLRKKICVGIFIKDNLDKRIKLFIDSRFCFFDLVYDCKFVVVHRVKDIYEISLNR